MRKPIPRVLGGTLIGVALGLGASGAAVAPTATRITDNSSVDRDPDTSGSNVVWAGDDGNDDELHLWGGAIITNISDNRTSDYDAVICVDRTHRLGFLLPRKGVMTNPRGRSAWVPYGECFGLVS